jgi:hypothetical protein
MVSSTKAGKKAKAASSFHYFLLSFKNVLGLNLFPIDSMNKRMLLEGIDEIDYTLQLVSKITDYENKFSPKTFLNESKK